MRSLVLGPAKEAVQDGLSPFKGTSRVDKDLCWIGPYHLCGRKWALHGPLQLFFILLFFLSIAALIVEYERYEFDWLRTISGVLLILVCLYMVYLGKAIYVLKAFRKEIVEFRRLNKQLSSQVDRLEGQNEQYEERNREHERLNKEMEARAKSLGHVEERLTDLSHDCNGSVKEARSLLTRLDRFVRLDTVNSVFQFFDRSDRDKNGKVDGDEVSLFVDSLGYLWKHLPHFDPERIKEEIVKQGGMSLEQVHRLVDLMLLEEAGGDLHTMSQKLEQVFAKEVVNHAQSAETGHTKKSWGPSPSLMPMTNTYGPSLSLLAMTGSQTMSHPLGPRH